MGGGDGSVNCLAEVAIVERRDIGGDEFTRAGGERVGRVQQNLRELIEWLGGLRAEGHGPANALQSFR